MHILALTNDHGLHEIDTDGISECPERGIEIVTGKRARMRLFELGHQVRAISGHIVTQSLLDFSMVCDATSKTCV
jgi:hypothetical protein